MSRPPPRRIASVCPSNTDLMAHLGLLDRVVARDSWSDWPAGEVDRIPVIGEVLAIDLDALRATEPDLILASRNVPGMERVVPQLEATGIPVAVYDPETWADVLENLRDLGDRLGCPGRAREVIDRALARVRALEEESRDLPEIPVAVEWWAEPVIMPFRETYVNQVLGWVRARPIFRDRPGRSGVVTPEEVASAAPELYAVSWCGTAWEDYRTDSVHARYDDASLPFRAAPDRVFKLWEGEIGHPSLRLLDGAARVLEQRRIAGV